MLESPTINDSSGKQTAHDGGRLQPDASNNASIETVLPPALLLGDHSVSDPPDPISNSAVKPDSADGTNAQALEE